MNPRKSKTLCVYIRYIGVHKNQ